MEIRPGAETYGYFVVQAAWPYSGDGETTVSAPYGGQMTIAPDLHGTGWLTSASTPFRSGVASLVPPVFADYARVLHPAYADDGQRIRWAEIAAAHGRRLHRRAQFPSLVGTTDFENGPPMPDVWCEAPAQGSLPPVEAASIADVLGRHTSSPDRVWFGVWDGFAGSTVRERTPLRFAIPGRALVPLVGPVGAAIRSYDEVRHQSANLWWPKDRAWFVATDIDLVSSYIGGSAAAVAELLAHPGLEALRVEPTDRIGWDADDVDPAPDR